MRNKKKGTAARRNRVKGRTTARVASVNSIIHLDSTSELHAEHQKLSKRIHARANQEVLVNIEPQETLKFPSLGKGVMLDGKGSEINGDAHLELLNRLTNQRGYYHAQETRKNGTTYQRKLKTTGIHQLAVTYYPVYSMAFSRLENEGIPMRDLVLDHTRKLGAEFNRLSGYEVVAMQVHPNEGILHPHLCYATVDEQHKLLHPLTGPGRRGLRFLGPASIGTLRLVENNLWPESDAVLVRKFLAGSVRRGQEPLDWILSRYLDGLAEKTLIDLSKINATVSKIWKDVVSEYSSYAKTQRESRPDLMAENIVALTAENESLRAELTKLKQGTPPKSQPVNTGPRALPALKLPPEFGENSRRSNSKEGISNSL